MRFPNEPVTRLAGIKQSFDHQNDTDAEELWLQEAERRYREYREGKLKTRPAEDVFRDAFSKVR